MYKANKFVWVHQRQFNFNFPYFPYFPLISYISYFPQPKNKTKLGFFALPRLTPTPSLWNLDTLYRGVIILIALFNIIQYLDPFKRKPFKQVGNSNPSATFLPRFRQKPKFAVYFHKFPISPKYPIPPFFTNITIYDDHT